MTVEQRIDDLIESGWHVLDSNFDATAFAYWRRKALDCVTVLLGPSHTCTCYFRGFVEEAETESLLVGDGILAAAKEQLATSGFELRDKERLGKRKLFDRPTASVSRKCSW